MLDATPRPSDAGIDAPLDALALDAQVAPRPDVYVEPGVDAALDAHEAPEIDAALPTVDAGTLVDAGTDAATRGLCEGMVDGHPCGDLPRRICVDARCVIAECGDGHVEPSAGEACEPSVDGPGCNPLTCRWQCVDGLTCPSTTCLVGTCGPDGECDYAPVAGRCMADAVTDGMCEAGRCTPIGCGNGRVEPGEQCDPPGPGCTGCRFDCNTNDDCQDGDPCDGVERCEDVPEPAVGRRCVESVPACAPATACRRLECVAMSPDSPFCSYPLADDPDGDGYTAMAGCGSASGDCAPSDRTRHPMARELCNGLDDDCDGDVDEDTGIWTWCADGDGDGFGDPTRAVRSCEPVLGHVLDCDDCFDTTDPSRAATAALVHPGQTSFFGTPYVGASGAMSFDYDCSSRAELEFEVSGLACGGLLPLVCPTAVGWQDDEPPACGSTGSFATCRSIGLGPLSLACFADVATRTQRCH